MRLRTTVKALAAAAVGLGVGIPTLGLNTDAWAARGDAMLRLTRTIVANVPTAAPVAAVRGVAEFTHSLAGASRASRSMPDPKTPPPPPVDSGKSQFGQLVVKNLGPVVNSDVNDFSPTVTADGRTMFFVSERPGTGKEDFWMTTSPGDDTTWGPPIEVKAINSPTADGAASITADGQTIYFATSRGTTDPYDVDIWVASLEGTEWKNLHEVGAPINTPAWETQPSISPDGKTLFFASNRPGKIGGEGKDNVDLFVSHMLPDGRWSNPVNLGSTINTNGYEASPFMAADGKTLYFCSSGHGGLGQIDIFRSEWGGKSDSDWSAPVALPAPINSPYNDFFMTVPASGKVLFFTSDRPGGSGKYDIYVATNPPAPKSTLVLRGTCYDVNTKEKLGAHVVIIEEKTGDTIYNKFANSATGEYLAVLPSDANGMLGGNYLISATEPNHFPYQPTREVIPLRSDTSRIITHDIPMNNEVPPIVHWVTQTPQLLKEKPDLFGSNFKGVVIREQQTIELYTLLPMVFFDLGTGTLPNRYVLYKTPNDTVGFKEDTLSSTMNAYYNYLNILGLRMKQNPETKITLTGTNSQDVEQEKSIDLSRQRADFVKKYLVEIWGIDPNRISVEARKLPENPTLPTTPEGIEENRRVEIASDSWDLVHPVLHSEIVKRPDAPTAGFTFENGLRDDAIAKRELLISYQGKPWATITNLGNVNTTSYNGYGWRSAEGNRLPSGEDKMQVQLRVTAKDGREVSSNVDEVQVRQFSVKDVVAEHLSDKTRETYNLILFKYNSADMGKWNHKILDTYVYGRIKPNSDVTVNGYTDILGTPDYNEKLSTNRANAVKKDIGGHIGKAQSLVAHGYGKTQPLYTNDLPEGRYYNRTVQVLVETPIDTQPK